MKIRKLLDLLIITNFIIFGFVLIYFAQLFGFFQNISIMVETMVGELFYKLPSTLESGINIRVRLLISEVFSRGYVLIKGGYVY